MRRHKNYTAQTRIFLLCGSYTLAALLRKQQSGFLWSLRVKGHLWLHAKLMTGNIEIWLSSGIALLYVLVCSAVAGMWEIMCTARPHRAHFSVCLWDTSNVGLPYLLHHNYWLHTCVWGELGSGMPIPCTCCQCLKSVSLWKKNNNNNKKNSLHKMSISHCLKVPLMQTWKARSLCFVSSILILSR